MDYFSFEIDGAKVGYYEEGESDGVFYCNAFLVIDGQQFENPFWIKHEGDQVTAYKCEDPNREFTSLEQSNDLYPSSAISLLAKKLKDGDAFRYRQLFEASGAIEEDVFLKREGNRVMEFVSGQPGRYLIFEDGKIIEYGWGGTAKSVRADTLDDARSGTAFA